MRGSVSFGCILNISIPLGGEFDIRIPLGGISNISIPVGGISYSTDRQKHKDDGLNFFFCVAHLFVGGWEKSKFEVLCFENRDIIFHNRQRLAHTKNL